MATDDQQRLVTGVASAPATFTIPGNGQMRPKAIFAHYDGTGAGGTFTPSLKITSDAGKLVGIYPVTSSIAAGGSAEVSWFPGAIEETALSTPGLMAAKVTLSGNQTIVSGDPNKVISWSVAVADTGSPTPFFDAGSPTRLTAPVAGLYLPLASLNWAVYPGTQPGQFSGFGCYLYVNSGGVYTTNYTYEYNNNPVGGTAAFRTLQGGHHNTLLLSAGDYVEIAAYQDSGNNIDLIDLRPVENHYCAFSLILVAVT